MNDSAVLRDRSKIMRWTEYVGLPQNEKNAFEQLYDIEIYICIYSVHSTYVWYVMVKICKHCLWKNLIKTKRWTINKHYR